jgi:hypothetical protein
LDVFSPEFAELAERFAPTHMLLPDVLEHLQEPVAFLRRIAQVLPQVPLIVSVPNGLSLRNFRNSLGNVERINTDHLCWYSPFTTAKLLRDNLVTGINLKPEAFMHEPDTCAHCVMGKHTKQPFPNSTSEMEDPGSMIHSDILALNTPTTGGRKYVLTLLDHATRYSEIRVLHSKSDAGRARSCPTTTSTTPTPPLNWWPNLRAKARPAPSSNTPTLAAWAWAAPYLRLTCGPITATRPRPLAGSWH